MSHNHDKKAGSRASEQKTKAFFNATSQRDAVGAKKGKKEKLGNKTQSSSNKKESVSERANSEEEAYCFFCGTLPDGSQLIEGVEGVICSSCVFALGARLAESEREGASRAPKPRTVEQMYAEEGDLPAHEYQNRVDLACAYVELGKKNLALKELFAALESSLICQDWVSSLRIIAKIREVADGPTLRDRIHEALSIHGPKG